MEFFKEATSRQPLRHSKYKLGFLHLGFIADYQAQESRKVGGKFCMDVCFVERIFDIHQIHWEIQVYNSLRTLGSVCFGNRSELI